MASKLIFRMENKSLTQNSIRGDLRVWSNYIKYDGAYIVEEYEVDTILDAVKLITEMIESQKIDNDIKQSAFGLNIYNGVDWIQWTDSENNSIQHYWLDEYGKLSVSGNELWLNELIG